MITNNESHMFTQPLHYKQAAAAQGQFLNRLDLVLNSEFSLYWTAHLTKAQKTPCLPYYLPIGGWGFRIH